MKNVLVLDPNDCDVYYDFEDEVAFSDSFADRVVIGGNRNYKSFGDSKLISIIDGSYYDDDLDTRPEYEGCCIGYDYEVLEELKKVTGKTWAKTDFIGYSQGDWQTAYYVEGEVSKEELDYLEAFYMNKVDAFTVYELEDTEEFNAEFKADSSNCYTSFVPHSVSWSESKEKICDYLGIDAETTKFLKVAGYIKIPQYEEVK